MARQAFADDARHQSRNDPEHPSPGARSGQYLSMEGETPMRTLMFRWIILHAIVLGAVWAFLASVPE